MLPVQIMKIMFLTDSFFIVEIFAFKSNKVHFCLLLKRYFEITNILEQDLSKFVDGQYMLAYQGLADGKLLMHIQISEKI